MACGKAPPEVVIWVGTNFLEEYSTLLVPSAFQPASDIAMAGWTENKEDSRNTAALFK